MKNSLFRRACLQVAKFVSFIGFHLLGFTIRYKVHGLAKPYPKAVYAFWHRNIIPLLVNRRHEGIAIMISPSKDGDYMAVAAEAFSYIPVRGSSSRKSIPALKEMIKRSKNHSLAITPDGPKGPAQQMKEGTLTLALLTQLPIYAVKVDVSHAKIFRSWDRLILPAPFSRVDIYYSEPFTISSTDEFETKKSEIERFMNGQS
jgi:hypothetical protein